MCDKIRQNKLKQLETAAVDSVYCLSQSEAWRYKLAENLYFIARIRMHWDKTAVKGICSISFYCSFIAHMRTAAIKQNYTQSTVSRCAVIPRTTSALHGKSDCVLLIYN